MSYVIVTLSRHVDLLTQFLGSVRAAGETCLVAVADDGLTRKNWAEFGEVELVQGPVWDFEHRGKSYRSTFVFSRSANHMLRRFPNHDVFLANDDIKILGREAPLRHLAETAASTDVGVVSPTVDSTACHGVQLTNAQRRLLGLPNVDLVHDAGDQPFYFSGVFLSKLTRQRVGLLDENLINSSDDVDYCMRCRAAGLKNIVDGRCQIWHGGSATFKRGWP